MTKNTITISIDVLWKHNEFLMQESASKNTIIKFFAENQQ